MKRSRIRRKKEHSRIWIDVPCKTIEVDGSLFTVQVSAIKKHGIEKVNDFCKILKK